MIKDIINSELVIINNTVSGIYGPAMIKKKGYSLACIDFYYFHY